MSNRKKVKGILATTHIDRHGERFSREALEIMAGQDLSEQPVWINWDHQTTIPPIGFTTQQFVEQREDGEYQIVNESEFFESEDYIPLPLSNIGGLDITDNQIEQFLQSLSFASDGYLEVVYDPHNFAQSEIEQIVESLNELVPTDVRQYLRKAEIPPPVIWVLVTFLGGLVGRYGEMAAEKALEAAKPFLIQLNGRFSKFFSLKPDIKPDVIFIIPIPESQTIVEGALEDADKDTLEVVWQKLPALYAFASYIIKQNQKDYFAQLKFLFNPRSSRWEVNFFTTRKNHRVIQGPRYYDRTNPLRKRWETELRRIQKISEENITDNKSSKRTE